jgi:hypothetical protein
MIASPPAKMTRSNIRETCCYSLYLISPVVTLTLLSTNHWLPDGSLCDPNMQHLVYVPTAPDRQSSDAADEVLPVGQLVVKTLPCTCKTEFPVTVSVLAGIDFFMFILLLLFNPIANEHWKDGLKRALKKRSPVSYALYLVAVAYVVLLNLQFVFMLQSNLYCGVVMFLWTLFSTVLRFVTICFCMAMYYKEDDATHAGNPVQM